MFVGCFILEAAAFFSMFLMNMSPIPLKQTFCLRQTLKQTMKRQTVKMSSCHVVHLKRQTVKMSSCHVVNFQTFVKKIMAHLNAWSGNTMKGGQVQVNLIGNAGVTGRLWTLVLGCCVVFLSWRTWHRMKVRTTMSWVIGLRQVRFLKLTPHHLPIQKIWRVGVPMILVCQNAQTHQMVQRDQIWSVVSLNWVMDISGWNMSAGAIGLMTGDVIACSQEDAHLLGE